MSEGEHIDIDPMLFLGLVIEDQLDVLAMTATMGAMFGDAHISEGVADIAREHIEKAQVALDALIEADTTWRPIKWNSEWCLMTHEGFDTDGSEWNRCIIHDELVLGDAYVCEGYTAPPYVEGTS